MKEVDFNIALVELNPESKKNSLDETYLRPK